MKNFKALWEKIIEKSIASVMTDVSQNKSED